MDCKFCKNSCRKAGKQRNGCQRYHCKACKKYQQKEYIHFAYQPGAMSMTSRLVCESVSVRGISRVLRIALATAGKWIRMIATNIAKQPIPMHIKTFELDELRTYICKKENQHCDFV